MAVEVSEMIDKVIGRRETLASTNIRSRIEHIKTLVFFIESQRLSKQQKAALQGIRKTVDNLLQDIKQHNIEVEWGKNSG